MAKNQGIDPKASTAARIRRTEAYAEKVRLLFAQTVNEILALNKTMPKLDDGVMFSFDGESMKKQKEVEALLRRLHSAVTMAIREGVSLEWSEANAEADKLIKSVFGQAVLDSPEFTAWTQRNTAARDAFLARSEKGLNLSDRVWKSVRQLRDELEVAVTVSMGEGKSASAMSREVRQYLNDPDLMFRRFRYKKGEDAEGNPIYGRKWKKRVKDEATGKYKWIDYDRDSYKTGAGVYKSSAKNAMRLTRTETNIAYRRADHERWMQEDFVIGQRIRLSNNHPEKDICDKLQGDYPKEFVFDGWHPQCFCYAVPITIADEDTDFMEKWFLEGKDWEGELKRRAEARMVRDYPEGFKEWVAEHAEDIKAARRRGTEPYFIRENAAIVDRFMGDAAPEPMKVRYVPDGLEKGQRKAWIDNSRETAEAIGVVQGEPMTFDEANELRGNPHYEAGTASGYTTNCQCAVVANELRRRGFDVEALPNIGTKGSVPYRLSRQTELAWIDPALGEAPKKVECNEIKHVGKGWKVRSKGLSIEQITENIDNATKQPGRYHIDFTWKGTGEGHIIAVERLENGKLRFYDPQTGKVVSWVKDYSARVSTVGRVSVLRVDGMMPNPEIVKEAVVKAGTAKSATAAAGIGKGEVKGDSETLAKRMLKWGQENIIGKYTFTHPAFNGKAAIFSRKSFTKNLGNGELGEVKADILMNIKSYLKPDMEMVYRSSTHGDNNGVFVATSKYTGDLGQFKGRDFELQFRISNNGDIVFYCIKLLT